MDSNLQHTLKQQREINFTHTCTCVDEPHTHTHTGHSAHTFSQEQSFFYINICLSRVCVSMQLPVSTLRVCAQVKCNYYPHYMNHKQTKRKKDIYTFCVVSMSEQLSLCSSHTDKHFLYKNK